MVSNIFYFHPYLGKIPILTNIFQMGWNHKPETLAIGLNLVVFWSCKFSVVISFFPPESYTDHFTPFFRPWKEKAALRIITTGRREPNPGAEYYYLQGSNIPPWWIHLHPPARVTSPEEWFISKCASRRSAPRQPELRDAQLVNSSFLDLSPKNKETNSCHKAWIPRPKQTFSSFFFFQKVVHLWSVVDLKPLSFLPMNLEFFGHPELCCWFGCPADVFQYTHYPKQNSGQVNLCLSKKSIHMRFPLLQMCNCICTHTLYNRKDVLYIYMYYIYIYIIAVYEDIYVIELRIRIYIYIQIYISKMLV